ncbi:MAG: hypothetical protein J5640_03085 [Bacteroidales bacterium]|nr:hypothetical protein [Bacteroidales bacterium]
MKEACYIQVIVPLRLEWTPTYRSPEPLEPGTRVSVVFARRSYVGVVWKTGVTPDIDGSRIQDILRVEDALSPVTPEELKFWEFISDYYLCTIGEVFKAAYPAGKIRSEQKAADILQRLKSRLAVREEALSKKHKDNVRERLESERDAIAAQIEALTKLPDGARAAKQAPGKPLLLTGGGRTDLYLQLCSEALRKGLNVLILTPEIAASEQLDTIFEESFPGQVHCVSSHITETRRGRIADDIRRFGGQVVVGTRSALFLPWSRLGLIIVENEQDVLFKQTEPAPRYNARDAAVMLGRIHSARVVLGAPSPSLESLHNAITGKYVLQHTGTVPPPPLIIDISAERRKNGMLGRISRKLLEAARKAEGPVALVRGWEKPDELTEEVHNLFPDTRVDILTLQQARLSDLRGYALIAVLQADALFPEGDFRADERAVQALAMLREQCAGPFIVQTAKADHPVFRSGEDIAAELLEERRAFGLPPYTRLIDTDFGGHKERLTFPCDSTLSTRKKQLLARARAFEKKAGGRVRVTIDVDPTV